MTFAGDGHKPCLTCRNFGHECVVRKRKLISQSASPESNSGDPVLDRLSRLESLIRAAAQTIGNPLLHLGTGDQSAPQSMAYPTSPDDLGLWRESLPAPKTFASESHLRDVRSVSAVAPMGDQDVESRLTPNLPATTPTLGSVSVSKDIASSENEPVCDESVCSMEMVRFSPATLYVFITNLPVLSLTWNTLVCKLNTHGKARIDAWS